jgi:hypothetical protein
MTGDPRSRRSAPQGETTMQQPTAAGLIVQLVPMIILSLPLLIGVFWLAPKMRSNPWLWAILFLIPMVNLFAVQIFLILTAGKLFDRLNAIAPVAAGNNSE